MRRVLCVWLPDWPIQQWCDARPALRERRAANDPAVAVALYEAAPRGALQIAYCSAAARVRHIRPGMSLAEATAVIGPASKHSHLERYDPVAARGALVALAEWCRQFSPTVGLEEAERPESLLLDVTGLGPLFGGEAALAQRVRQAFCRRGLAARLAVADTIGAAWAVTHYGANDECGTMNDEWGEKKNAAQKAGRMPAPHSSFIIHHSSLSSLPLAALRLSDEHVQLLAELGLKRIGQLEPFSRAALATRFGPELLRRWDQLTGTAEEVIAAAQPPPTLVAAWSCEQPIAHAEVIEAILGQLLDQLIRPLVAERRGVLQLACRLHGAGGAIAPFTLGLFRPSAAPRYLLDLVRLKLQRLSLAEPVTEIEVEVTATALVEFRQQELFEARSPRDDPRHLAALVDRLSSRLGREQVLRARLSDDAQPERAWRYEPVLDAAPGRRGTAAQGPPRTKRAPARGQATARRRFKWAQRPLRLAARPVPVVMTAVMPDGPPLQFALAGRPHRVTRYWGPERIETGWWRGRPIHRDYYRVETSEGARHWLFRRLTDGAWFWHGEFD
ncbi:MAG: DNA polymerase Y family protein [Planctomycetia bacterium]|nr:DNA polymerase Y family protein [Planctomycetia bacterium]